MIKKFKYWRSPLKFNEYKLHITSDLYRYCGRINFLCFMRYILFGTGFKYSFWMRTANFTKSNLFLKFIIYPISRVILRHLSFKLGISIPYNTRIDKGFYIGHFGGIVINSDTVIGINCNISQGVTLGQANRGKNKGTPIIGNNVYIGPGAKIVGAVKVGNNVAIGANCVVTKDIADNSVVVGIPGRVISDKGAVGYVHNTEY